ncbi:dynein heavy chain [Echinococcus multilocularis]|uniref:Dynein axonemal heavy chain 2 n=1 Tax=Echinococcus multilocularis TaxID=6211 RepID=A0A068Y8G0_ECHMU|nr:dynein heavy chain [Echinococcus multilocularis]
MIRRTKERFKLNLLAESERLKMRISALLSELQANGHHNLGPPPEEALAVCQAFRDRLAVMMEKENEIRSGLLIFKIDHQPCKESALVQKELDILEQIWTLNKEWEENWMGWKHGKFSNLQTDDMETLATAMFRKFTRLVRDNRSRRWDVLDASRDRIDQFRRMIPLIADLRNSAMRPRHWDAIRKEMARDFDQNDETFTLEKMISLGFDCYAAFISELSQAATKELGIEKALIKIESVWATIEMDVVPYKDKGHLRLRSTDDLFNTIEDHQVQLSAMKASRFVKPFEHEVDLWERALSKITETIELLLTVQRQWLYMETIFMGDDIRKQLPKESTLFDDLDVEWKRIMTAMNEVKNARRCCDLEGICEVLAKMNEKFEVIEKSLDMYLETKRQTFPRFYFISNEDLLEILGQGKNPEAIIPHLKKCFDNINTVKLEKKTIKKAQIPATKGHSSLKPQISRKQPTDLHKNYEGIDEASQDVNMAPAKETPTFQEEQRPSPEGKEHEEAPEAVAESAANRLERPRKFSTSEVPLEVNQSSTHLRTNSNAMHIARRSELREIYFGSSGSDNNISRSGSAVTVIDWNMNAAGYSLGSFTGGHNAVAQTTSKKANTQMITYTLFDGVAMISTDGEEVPWKKNVRMEGPVEMWLLEIESQMRKTLRDLLRDCRLVMKKASVKREKAVKEWPGQICITTSQIQWTADVTKALIMVNRRHDKKPLRMIRKKQKAILKRFSEAIRSNLSKMQRLKINGLVVIEVHQRDIIDKLYKSGCNDTGAFEWLAQLRFYWEKEEDDCYVKQTNASFHYGYEYLGNSGRLVITPLTDRCYITLTTALSLNRGGSPKGPAGTGKTETTKDLGKNLGDYVIVINCSDGLDYKSMGRMFSGLAQSGAWGCFDEFNRINIEVLSVVAQQILAILSALASLPKGKGVPSNIRFMFEGRMIKLVWSCGIFITMNPGYAGRTELPDNLKSMFRPIAMVVPDFTMIAEITLFAEGFDACKVLAKKVFTLYSLCNQQLSKQDHYDFGLRALISVLRYAGRKKRANPGMQDEEILLLSMNDMNLAKLTSADLPLFKGIVSDLFPGIEVPAIDYTNMRDAINEAFRELRLQATKFSVSKVIELYETQSSRHSVMIVGKTLSGKSATWKVLQLTQRKMMEAGYEGFYRVWDYPLNPKAISLGELYGEFNISTNEWSDGILSSLMRQACADEKPDYKWILFDGPVDALWIESMNSVMDDNKILTLINGERISMPDQVSLLFEVEDLAVASPATVSRAGMVYNDVMDLGWWPYVNSWLTNKESKILATTLTGLFERDIPQILNFTMNNCNKLIPVSETNLIISLCRLFDVIYGDGSEFDMSDLDLYTRLIEMLFQFCTIWSVCCVVDEDGRKKVDSYIREIDGSFPNKDSVFEFFLDVKSRAWIHWEEKLRGGWKYDPEQPFYKILVPTVDTIRYNYLVNALVSGRSPVLITGPVGTGKTSIAQDVLFNLDKESWTYLIINMSAQTSSNNVQDIIESRVEKRTKGTYVPTRGTKMVTFMDDLNMPVKDEFGSQPPLELIRQWIDYGFWYDREKQLPKRVQRMFLLGGMGPPGGGRMSISRRLQSRFNQINVTFPTDANLKQIFGTMINQKIANFEDEVKSMGDTLTDATVSLYNSVVTKFLPTPTRIHYLFNLRDISKICQGILRANKITIDSKTAMLRLWIHESFRVFADRLINAKDMAQFIEIMGEKLAQYFDQTFHNLCPSRSSPVFVDVLNKDMIYEDIQDIGRLREGLFEFLNEYNDSPGVVPMDLVLFKDAIEHTCKILRVISQPRGNMLLIGVGGSGRNSVTKLAGYICRYKVFSVEVNKAYKKADFREDLKRLYRHTGVQCQSTLFLFSDTHVAEEAFLEDINNMLSSGEVPNLFKADEFEEVSNAIIDQAKKQGMDESPQSIYRYFIERVRANLHIVLCMSPIGDPFRDRMRMYPGFVNCTTIDWFSEWPNDALLEVATKYLSDLDLLHGNEDALRISAKMKSGVARVFALMHNSVTQMSEKMMDELRRRNYVTPTNYLELVSGYKKMLELKRRELSDWANKLRSGLGKIDDTRTKVEEMSIELSEAKEKVAVFQKECDDYLIILVEQRREADEQTKSVTLTKEKIKVDEAKCLQMAEVAQADLVQAMPALEAAITALEALNKKDITEIKSYGQPPHLVRKVMEAVMILRQAPPTWAEAKKHLGEQDFINQLVNFDKDHISDKTLKKISAYCAQDDFMPEVVGKVSFAAKSLCMWVRAMEVYGRIYRYVEPKRQRLLQAEAILAEKRAQLAAAQAKLDALMAEMARLQQEYNDKMEQKDELRRKAEALERMLERARMLVDGLADEKVRWTQTVFDLERRIGLLPGDCLLSAGFISYMGPFLSKYREELVSTWAGAVETEKIPISTSYSFTEFLSDPAKVREWNIQGLPRDSFSVDNGVIVSRASRWPLMIDPQCQAVNWVKSMEGSQLQVIDLQMRNYMQILERAIATGWPVLLQNILETLDPGLDPILNKSLMKVGGADVIRLGDREVEYNSNFRFYLTTKLSNPRYAPEICTKTTVVNFAVMQEGLEAQLLGIVVRKEKPELEEQKDSLVIGIANGKKKLKELEDELLRLLNETQGSLLEDEGLFLTLQTSKVTSVEVTEFLSISERTEVQIDTARDGYRPCARRAAILFFVLNDLGSIDPMYQFALDAYIDLFVLSIEKSQRSPRLSERIENLNKHHTYAVYRYTCRGLFERHKLLFSFQICIKIMEEMSKLNLEEYMFFLRGGIVLDRAHQMDNPVPSWLSSLSWDNVTELNKLANYRGIVTSFEQYPRDWHIWYTSDEPENTKLPAEWESSTNEFQRMLIVRSLRPDRVTFCATAFITNNIGKQFVEPPVLDMRNVVEDSSARTPLIFVLSPGVDPTGGLLQMAEACGMGKRFNALSLGQGQAPIATRLIEEAMRNGNWVFLANCHLSLSWMPQLDKLVEQMGGEQTHGEFRLWLSSSPTPHFPISILQAGIKMTTEPPKGLRANMKRLYQIVKEDQFSACTKPEKYKKLLFCLCFFHAVLIERRKFRMLGWNVAYEFNDADFEVSENILSTYLDQYQDTPWEALRYLVAGINYGGHVTDDWDRRLLLTYINGYFTENVINEAFFKLSPLAHYYVPRDGSLSAYREFVSMLPNIDHPEAFGQHLNADIASQIQEAKILFDALLSLQPKISSAGEESKESKVLKLIQKMKEQIPDNLDYDGTVKIFSNDRSPLKVVLLQEIQRYNDLLDLIRNQLIDLERGIQGLVVMSLQLEEIVAAIFENRVPLQWQYAYNSLRPLSSWVRDLAERIKVFLQWSQTAKAPKTFWIGAFTFPTGFLTAVMQMAARTHGVGVDALSWDFNVLTISEQNIPSSPKEGVYVCGLFLEGAGWDMKNQCLVEAAPMMLVCVMPVIHFKAIENKKKAAKSTYICPCYYYQNRAGPPGKPSFMIGVELKTGDFPPEHWIKRGTALLMSLDN